MLETIGNFISSYRFIIIGGMLIIGICACVFLYKRKTEK